MLCLTKEAVDDAEQTTHGADDGRDDVILPLYLQTASVDLGHACPGRSGAHPRGICHSGLMWEAEVWDEGRLFCRRYLESIGADLVTVRVEKMKNSECVCVCVWLLQIK